MGWNILEMIQILHVYISLTFKWLPHVVDVHS
jgi:hypothetical protein